MCGYNPRNSALGPRSLLDTVLNPLENKNVNYARLLSPVTF